MDFQKMVRQFRESVLDENEPQLRPQLRQPQLISEMASEQYREAAEEKISQLGLLEDLSWGSLFPEAAEGTNDPAPDGRATRMILDFVPDQMKMAVQIGKKLTKLGWIPSFDEKEVTQKRTVRNAQGEEERVETKENIAQLKYHKKIKKVIPKGPRAGEEIEKVIQTKLGQLIQKHGTPEEKEFWTAEQIRFRDLDTANEYFFKPHARRYQDKEGAYAVMITRHPIDVLRLSDFSDMKYSCWSEGGQYGHCSKDEALTGGPVAFLVPKAEIEKVSLQDLHGMEEVFSDSDIGSEGKTTAEPSSRLRLVALRSEDSNLAVPAAKVYGIDVPGFKSIVSDFMWKAQKDIIVRDGSAEQFAEELDAGIWERTGGQYSDQENLGGRIGALIAEMIPEEAGVSAEQLGTIAGMNVTYDVYSGSEEDIENLVDQAQERLDDMMREWNDQMTHVSVWMEAEQYDENDFYISTSADTMVSIPAPTHEQELKYGLSMIPHYENRNDFGESGKDYWQYSRSFEKTIGEATDATENLETYEYENLEVNLTDDNIEIRFTLSSADIMNHGMEGVDEVEYWLDQTVEFWDTHHDELRRNIIVALQSDEYLPPAKGFATAKTDISKEGVPNTFKNFEVEMMDDEKPAEGIIIGTKEQGRLNFALGVYDTVDKATGAEIPLLAVLNGKARIADEDPQWQFTKGNVRQRIEKALVAELQKLEDEAEEYAKKQLSLPFGSPEPQGDLDLGSEYEREDKLSYERRPQTVPEFDFKNSGFGLTESEGFGFRFDVIEEMENKVLIGIHMDFEVAVDATEENYDAIKAFVTYLDGSKERLVEALQNLIDPYYEAIRASSINMQKGEHDRMKQKVADAEAAGKDPLAAGAYYRQDISEAEEMQEGDLRHIIREALKRKLLKEQGIPSYLLANTDEPEPEESTPDIDLITPTAGQKLYSDLAAIEQRRIDNQAQKEYVDQNYGEGSYDLSQETGQAVSTAEIAEKERLRMRKEAGVSYDSVLDDPLASPSEVDSYWQNLSSNDVVKFVSQLEEIPGDRQSDAETGETLINGLPISDPALNLPPELVQFLDWQKTKKTDATAELFRPHEVDGEVSGWLGGESMSFDHLSPPPAKGMPDETKIGGFGMRNGFGMVDPKTGIYRWHPAKFHGGLDIGVPVGTEMNAFVDMKFIKSGGSLKSSGGHSASFEVVHPTTGETYTLQMMHLKEKPNLKGNATFSKGDALGVLTGNTGGSTGPHLHLQVKDSKGKGVDPAALLCDLGADGYCQYKADSDSSRGRISKVDPDTDAGKAFGEREVRKKKWFDEKDPKNPAVIAAQDMDKGDALTSAEDEDEDEDVVRKTGNTATGSTVGTALEEGHLRHAIQEALKRKLSPLKEAEEMSSALLYQVVLVLSVTKPIRDIAGKLNRIRAIEGVTIVSHEREEETIYRGDVVAKVKFHPLKDMMTPTTFINQYLVPQINSSKIVPEVKVLQVVRGTIKEIT